jgi:uncharacterized membrane protein YjgN (DUF898 family)
LPNNELSFKLLSTWNLKWFCSGISVPKIDLRQFQYVVNECHWLEDGSLEVLFRNEQENKSFFGEET